MTGSRIGMKKTPIDEQAQHVWKHGQYLIDRQGQRTVANLYSVDSFYVEIWYDREHNSITAVTCFDEVSKLDAYLRGITLDGIG